MQSLCKASIASLVLLIWFVIEVSSVDTLKQGENLNSSSQLVSANGIYTLGFRTLEDTNSSYLAVWITDSWNHPVWIGNRERPVPDNASRSLTIGSRGELIIMHGGESIVLFKGGSGQNITASATLLDSGNFVVNSNESSSFLWQSFDYPTDTLLPGMKIGLNSRTGRNWTLSSWFGPSNPALGPFTLEWDPSADSFLVRRREVIYWRSGELKYYSDEGGKSRAELDNFNFRRDPNNFYYNFTKVTGGDEEYLIFSVIPTPFITPDEQKATGWRVDYKGDIFDTVRSITIARPSLCYNYYDEGSAVIRGCESREQPKCRNEHQNFVFKSGDFRPDKGRLDLVSDDNSSLSLSDCMETCWNVCDCFAYIDSAAGGCLYWRGENLEYVQSVDGSSVRKYFLDSSSKGKKIPVWIIITVVGSTVLLISIVTMFTVRRLEKGRRKEELHELLTLDGYTEAYELENGGANSHDLKLFTYASIVSATRNFYSGNKLGQGGFGPVYKGKTSEGQDIAVKLLSRQSGQGLIEFKTELILISKLQHVNLVKLLGFCIHEDDKMIIYEYMHNKSLDFFLFSQPKRGQLDWQKRFNIIEGIAQGLLYLHKYSRLRIIHRDLKPNNILLDENMNPKISDFGLARIFNQNANEANTNRRVGTYGYMAPEYAMQGIFSVKSDVYSFGILVLEIVSGRKNNSFDQIEGPLNLVEYAWDLWKKDTALELMDPILTDSCVSDQLQRCIHIGLLCVENHAVDRPTIEDAISMLKNERATLPMPENPAFITRNSVLEEAEKNTVGSSSANEVTLSEMHVGR